LRVRPPLWHFARPHGASDGWAPRMEPDHAGDGGVHVVFPCLRAALRFSVLEKCRWRWRHYTIPSRSTSAWVPAPRGSPSPSSYGAKVWLQPCDQPKIQ